VYKNRTFIEPLSDRAMEDSGATCVLAGPVTTAAVRRVLRSRRRFFAYLPTGWKPTNAIMLSVKDRVHQGKADKKAFKAFDPIGRLPIGTPKSGRPKAGLPSSSARSSVIAPARQPWP
jgi:hypothetical protein